MVGDRTILLIKKKSDPEPYKTRLRIVKKEEKRIEKAGTGTDNFTDNDSSFFLSGGTVREDSFDLSMFHGYIRHK